MKSDLIVFVVMLVGFFNGLAVSLYIYFKSVSNAALRWASLAIFLFSLSILKEFIIVFGPRVGFDGLFSRFFNFKLLALGFSLLALDNLPLFENRRIKVLIPGIFETLFLGLITLNIINLGKIVSDSLFILVDCVAFFWIFTMYRKKSKGPSKKQVHLRFLFYMTLGFLIIFLTRITQFIAVVMDSDFLYSMHFLFRIIAIGFVVYLISFYLAITFSKNQRRGNQPRISIKPEKQELLEQIESEGMFLDGSMTLEKLAHSYGTDAKTLSATVREYGNNSFNVYMNELRLAHFMDLIAKGEQSKYTLMALAEKSGFNSKATFNRAFKKKYGCAPSTYLKEHSID